MPGRSFPAPAGTTPPANTTPLPAVVPGPNHMVALSDGTAAGTGYALQTAFRGAAGPAGPAGPQGPQGPQGVQGPPGSGAGGLAATPEAYGAKGDGSTDDAPAFRAALDALRGAGNGLLQGTPGRTYKLNSGITWNPAFASIDMRGCTLDFSGVAAPPLADTSGADLIGFGAGQANGWVSNFAAPAWTANPVSVAANASGYTQAGKTVLAGAGTWRFTITYTAAQDFGLIFFGAGIGFGQTDYANIPASAASTTFTRDVTFASPRVFTPTFGGSGWKVTGFTMAPVGAISAAPTAGAVAVVGDGEQYGAGRNNWTGGNLRGPGKDKALAAFLHRTTSGGFSSRATRHDFIAYDFGVGDLFWDRAYAVHTYGAQFMYCGTCVMNVGGTDQGELFVYYGSKFFNSGVCVMAGGGGRFEFHACHLDYCSRWLAGIDGGLYFHGGWLEGNASDYDAQTMIDVGAGEVVFFGTHIQTTSRAPKAPALMGIGAGGRVFLKGATAYNWTTSGAIGSQLWTGAGKVYVDRIAELPNATFANKQLDTLA